jgi:hypothetical protein
MYNIYPTLLDKFSDYLNADKNWETYYGDSTKEDSPTIEEYEEKQRQSLIDSINRVPFESEAADKGTAFNMIVDSLINKEKPSFDVIKVWDDSLKGKGSPTSLICCYKNHAFQFDMDRIKSFSNYFRGAISQLRVEAEIGTKFGRVLLYGYIDELLPDKVCDIKTTKSYKAFKFRDHNQHLVYPYCLITGGNYIHTFEYNVTDFKDNYTEVYVFDEKRDIPILRDRIERFIEFLENNREFITDKKIYGD